MLWIDTKTDEDALRRSEALWTPAWTEHGDGSAMLAVPGPAKENGQFWADAIRKFQSDPAARLSVAYRHLPLPAAFREVSLALRAIIRRLRTDGEPFEGELRQLHYWAALNSWSAPFSEVLGGPGYWIFESTPYLKLAELDLSYEIIGSEELPDLNKTDRKMMLEAWGAPKAHSTAHALYGELWRRQERMLVEVRTNSRQAFYDEITAG